MDEITPWITNYGFPGTLLLALCWGARSVWAWFKPHGERIFERHLVLMGTLEEQVRNQREFNDRQGEHNDRLNLHMAKQTECMAAIERHLENGHA